MGLISVIHKLQDLGLVGAGIATTIWLLGGGALARSIAPTLAPYPMLGEGVVYAVAISVGFGGLLAFWAMLPLLENRLRGYGIRVVEGTGSWYEELGPSGGKRVLRFALRTTAGGYPAPREVALPSAAQWDNEVPQWAQGRRTEIMERINECLWNKATFVDRPYCDAA